MENSSTCICLWAGPRNISTALMYAFAQREDTLVFDEPLYGHYLSSRVEAQAYHPGAPEVLKTQEHDGEKVVKMMLGEHAEPIVFFKHMAHHLVDLDWSFMKYTVNVILIRDPEEMLPSYSEQIEMPSLYDVGFARQVEVLEYIKSLGQSPIILDAKQVLLNPEKVLRECCKRIGIGFDQTMLNWEAGARPEDGSWAQYWYYNVHRSTGFAPYRPKTEPFPEHLKPLLEECRPYYEQLKKEAILA